MLLNFFILKGIPIPVNIFWSSRYVLKVSSTRLHLNNFSCFKTSWRRRLQDIFEDEKLLRLRSLEDVLMACLKDVLKTCFEGALKTSFEVILKTSWKQTKCLLVIFLSDKSECVSNKSIFHKFQLNLFPSYKSYFQIALPWTFAIT